MAWAEWHKRYETSLLLLARLRIVREQIVAALDEYPCGPIKIVSLCAGDGRDLIEALTDHPRRADVTAVLLDTDVSSLERGRAAAVDTGLGRQLQFLHADATVAANYAGIVPADLVIISGVLGHVSEASLFHFLESLPMLCKTGGSVIWNRGLVANQGSKHVSLIRDQLRRGGFEELHYEVTSHNGFAVARARFGGQEIPLDLQRPVFEFAGLEHLLEQNLTPIDDLAEKGGRQSHCEGEKARAWGDLPDVEQSLPACFERQARIHPHKAAFGSGTWRATYEELNHAANRLGGALLSRGGAPGDRVAVLMEHDTPLVVAMLAALKAGKMVVVLDPTEPPARLEQVMNDAKPAVILTDPAHQETAARIASRPCHVLCVENQIAAGSAPNPDVRISPEDTAFLVYTSGSTGPPKGVMQSHRSILHKALRRSRSDFLRAEDRIILLASLSRGQGVNTTWCALTHGAALCPFPISTRGVTGLADWMAAHEITVYVSAASVFRHFARTLDDAQRFPQVRLVWLASEPATSEDFASWQKHFTDGCSLLHTLSSSETGTITQMRLALNDAVAKGPLPVGRPVEEVELLLLDEHGHEIPRGEAGEIAVRSRYLSTGYWRNESLTAKHFSATGPDGVKTFRSGDRGRLTADGLLMFLGRQDTRVNVHGYRVELSEIEDALSREPSVERAAVCASARPSGDVQLTGYVTVQPGHTCSADVLRLALRGALPGHMIPGAFVFLDSFPLTSNGKIDRQKLSQISPPASRSVAESAPATETEAMLAAIWSEAMEKDSVGRDDDFFDLGGDSLTAAVIAAKIHAALQVQLDLRAFAEHPTLAALASAVDALRASHLPESVLPLVRVPREGPLPLSFHQERIWKYSRTPRGAIGYTSARRHLIRGPLNVAVLRDCMTYLARRHDSLRTTFTMMDGRPVQVIHPSAPEPLPLIDLSGTVDSEERSDQLFSEEVRRPMDLERGPLMRFMLVRLRENEHHLFRIGHHIIDDAWSWDVYFRELGIIYEAKLRAEKPPLPEFESLQYADYAVWQRQVLGPETEAYRVALMWWKERFAAPPPPLELPFRRPSPLPDADPGEGSLQMAYDADIARRLNQVEREVRATFFVLRLAAFVALVAAESGQPDVVLGTYATNRNRVETQKMFGFFSNMVTLRFHCGGDMTFRDWVTLVGVLTSEFQARGEIPYEQLCEDLHKLGACPPEIRVIFQTDVRLDNPGFGGLDVTKLVRRGAFMPWGFKIVFYRGGGVAEMCRTSFDARLYEPSGVRQFVSRLVGFLDLASRQPDLPLARLLAESATALPSAVNPNGPKLMMRE